MGGRCCERVFGVLIVALDLIGWDCTHTLPCFLVYFSLSLALSKATSEDSSEEEEGVLNIRFLNLMIRGWRLEYGLEDRARARHYSSNELVLGLGLLVFWKEALKWIVMIKGNKYFINTFRFPLSSRDDMMNGHFHFHYHFHFSSPSPSSPSV